MDPDLLKCLAFAALMGGGILAATYQQRTHAAAMKQMAAELHLAYKPKEELSRLKAEFPSFSLLASKRSDDIHHVMTGQVDGFPLTIFECTIMHEEQRQVTVILFHEAQQTFPTFILRPTTFSDHLAKEFFGRQKIEFSLHPKFNERYMLSGPDEEAIQSLFTLELVRYLEKESNRDLGIEADGTKLLFYIRYKWVSPAELPAFIERGMEVLRHFARERPLPRGKGSD